jgi:hypothetical protein
MKVLFLDIDGVVNCSTTPTRFEHFLGIDPYMALLVDRIIQATGCAVVLSSSWRYHEDSMAEVRQRVCQFIDVTPMNNGLTSRGTEIKQWLDTHPEVTQYAILDDNTDFLEGQPLFRTFWEKGLTEEIAKDVTQHLNA